MYEPDFFSQGVGISAVVPGRFTSWTQLIVSLASVVGVLVRNLSICTAITVTDSGREGVEPRVGETVVLGLRDSCRWLRRPVTCQKERALLWGGQSRSD